MIQQLLNSFCVPEQLLHSFCAPELFFRNSVVHRWRRLYLNRVARKKKRKRMKRGEEKKETVGEAGRIRCVDTLAYCKPPVCQKIPEHPRIPETIQPIALLQKQYVYYVTLAADP